MECSICTDDYDSTAAHRPLVGRCGHSICASCVPSLNNNKCPSCQVDGSFANKAVNFQLIGLLEHVTQLKEEQVRLAEYLEAAGPLREVHEAQIRELQSQIDTMAVEKENTNEMMNINMASEEQLRIQVEEQIVSMLQMKEDREQYDKMMLERIEKTNRDLEEKTKRIEELEKKEKKNSMLVDTTWMKPWNCSSCLETVVQSKARICIDCGKKDRVIRDKGNGGYCIVDMDQLTHRSHADTAELISLIQRVGVARIRRAGEGLLDAITGTLPMLEKIRVKASTQKNEMEYNRMMAKCGSIKRVIHGVARDHEESCASMVEDVKQKITSRLQLLCIDERDETTVLVDSEDEE